VSDDGRFTIVVIALLGNPFSPTYARARARGRARALDFCALHVALYGPRRALWALSERSIPDQSRGPRELVMGRSRVAFERGALVIDVHESTTPLPGVVRGRVILRPEIVSPISVTLDAAGDHVWWPVAPLSHVEVDLQSPDVRFRGHGYHDANAGRVPIDASFSGWTWSRARLGDRVAVAYDVIERSGDSHARGMVFGASTTAALERTWQAPLRPSAWRLERSAAADHGHAACVARSLTDSPFYARSLVKTRLLGQETVAVHEVLSADRLRSAWVRFLLGFRMARAD
jgi:carotenoid 1,2-hydratase